LDPSGHPIVDSIDAFKAVTGVLGDQPCQEFDIRSGGFIIDRFPRISRFDRDVLKGAKSKRSFRCSFVGHIEPGASLAFGRVQWRDKGIFLYAPRDKANCPAGANGPAIFNVGPNT
jgi:hypothetical protein